MGPHSSPVRLYLLRARSIQPNFPEISVQNSMDRFGPTRKVSKKRVHLLRWSSFFRSDRSEFWSNGSPPKVLVFYRKSFSFTENWARGRALLFLIWIVPKSQCQGLILQMPDKIITIFLLMFLLFFGSVLTPRYTCRNTSLPS